MTHLTPEEVEIVSWLRGEAEKRCDNPSHDPESKHYDGMHRCFCCSGTGIILDEKYRIAADAIEQRAALAEQVRRMREALKIASRHLPDGPLISDPFSLYQGCPMPTKAQEAIEDALALPLPDAAKQVAEWKRKAAAFDALMTAIKSESEVTEGEFIGESSDAFKAAYRAAKEAESERAGR